MIFTLLDSPVGPLRLAGSEDGVLSELSFDGAAGVPRDPGWIRDDAGFPTARRQLQEYFCGTRRDFDVPLALRGSEWELRVWAALPAIPYGETRSYGQVAAALGARPSAASRAVGLANGRNPVAIIVPCHRVIGADGSLVGFGGGLERKRVLLDLEAGRLRLAV